MKSVAMASASTPAIRPGSSSACTGLSGGGDANHKDHTLPPSRSGRFQSLGEQLLVPKSNGTSSLSTSQSGPLPTVETLSSHLSKTACIDSPDAKSSGLPPMSKSSLASKAALGRPASTASLPFVPNAMGLTGNRRPSGTSVSIEDSPQRHGRTRISSKQTFVGELAPVGPSSFPADALAVHAAGSKSTGHSSANSSDAKKCLPAMMGGLSSEAMHDSKKPVSPSLAPLAQPQPPSPNPPPHALPMPAAPHTLAPLPSLQGHP